MQSTIIPPIPNLDLAEGRQYHLILTHLLADHHYLAFFREQAKKSFVILDNSAHEHKTGEQASVLLQQSRILQPSEIVLPDHLFDYRDTVHRTTKALAYFNACLEDLPQSVKRFMIVPQAENVFEYRQCLEELVSAFSVYWDHFDGFPDLTIGVSKDFEIWDGGIYGLLEKVVLPFRDNHCPKNTQIHLLGWGRKLWDLKEISRDMGSLIRSTDSAKPIIYGLHDIPILPYVKAPTYPGRPKDYFITRIPEDKIGLIKQNIEVFDNLVK